MHTSLFVMLPILACFHKREKNERVKLIKKKGKKRFRCKERYKNKYRERKRTTK